MTDKWFWYVGSNEEDFSLGPFDTRQDAIDEGEANYDEGFWIIEATKSGWPAPRASRLIEDMFENSEDLFRDEYPEIQGTLQQRTQAEEELQELLNKWMDKYRTVIFPEPYVFSAQANLEYIENLATED